MQTPELTKKWTDLRGIALVTINNGTKEGTLDDFYFDPQKATIYALRVKTGVFGHRILPVGSINAIGTDAITFANEQMLINEKDDELLGNLPFGTELLNYKVLTEGGTVVGSISNIVLNVSIPTQLRIAAYELPGNIGARLSGRHPLITADQVVRYGRDVVVIPDTVAQTLH